jgi:hypothetical protein
MNDMCGIESLAPFQGAACLDGRNPGHRPGGLNPGLGSAGPLGQERTAADAVGVEAENGICALKGR